MNAIDQLVKEAEVQQEAEEAANFAKLHELKLAAQAWAKEKMGAEVWDMLLPKFERNSNNDDLVYWIDNHAGVKVNLGVAGDALRLPDFDIEIRYWETGRGQLQVAGRFVARDGGFEVATLAEVFKQLREQYPDWKARVLQEQTNRLANQLRYWRGNALAPEQAQAIYKLLLGIDPENQVTWDNDLQRCLAEMEQKMRADQFEAEQKVLRAAAEEAYEAAYRVYWRQYGEALAANREALAKVQAELDRATFTCYELTYALVADRYDPEDNSSECDRAVDTRRVYVMYGQVDSQGKWRRVRNGTCEEVKYWNLVSLRTLPTVIPSQDGGEICGKRYVEWALEYVYFEPFEERQAMTLVAKCPHQELPEEPSEEGISSQAAPRIRRLVKETPEERERQRIVDICWRAIYRRY